MTENGNGANGNGQHRLTGLQRAFVDAWFGEAQFNGTESARLAGYSGGDNPERERDVWAVAAVQVLSSIKVQKEIDRRWAAHGMTPGEVVSRLAAQARADVSEFVGAGGIIDWQAVRENGHLIKRITHTTGKNSVIELHDAQTALVQVGRTMGLFVDRKKSEVDITSGGERIDPDINALAEAIAGLKPSECSEGCGGCES